MSASAAPLTLAVATPLEVELVERIRTADPGLRVLHEPELLPPTRYPGDHRGAEDFRRTPEQERRFAALLASADILFGLPGDSPEGLAAAVRANPRLRWVQGTAAGAGEQVRASGLTEDELARVVVTSAAGVHATPLAEFCLLGLLAFAKNLPALQADQRARRWTEHRPVGELAGRTLLVVGLGAIGTEVARLAHAFGMRVLGISRSAATRPHVETVHPPQALAALLPGADDIVISLPLTDETRGLFDAAMLSLCKPGATLVNVGRGRVIDEGALIAALRGGQLAGAALDVFATEPLPADNPLWGLPNVLIAPHTAALSRRENERIVAQFCENLGRLRRGEPLRNRVRTDVFY